MRNREAPHCDVPPDVPVLTGCQWISPDVTGSKILKKSNRDNDLQHSMDLPGTRWKVDVERVMGIEPTLAAWEAAVLPLSDTRAEAVSLGRAGRQGNAAPVAGAACRGPSEAAAEGHEGGGVGAAALVDRGGHA